MGKIQLYAGKCNPTSYMKRISAHKSGVSEGTRHEILARKTILGKIITFYRNGLHFIEDTDLDEEEMFNSELLRLTHASVLIQAPVGDKKACYIDATKEPVEVWIANRPINKYLFELKELAKYHNLDPDFVSINHRKLLE